MFKWVLLYCFLLEIFHLKTQIKINSKKESKKIRQRWWLMGHTRGLPRQLGWLAGKASLWREIVQFSRSVVSNSLWPHEPQHSRPPCPSPTPRVYLNSCPSSRWCHPTISSSVVPFSSSPQSFPASGSFQISQQFASGGQGLEFQLQPQSFQWTPRTDLLQDGLVGSPCSPRDSQESSPTPQFKSINSLALSFLYVPTLTSIHDYWKNHSLA